MKTRGLKMSVVSVAMAFALIGAAGLAGCGGGGSDSSGGNGAGGENAEKTPLEKLKDMQKSGELPTLDRSGSLAGIDNNFNGVRDDIEEYINRNYKDEKKNKALMQDARAWQAIMLIPDPSNKWAARKAAQLQTRSIHCAFLTFNLDRDGESPDEVLEKIQSMTTNTRARLKHYEEYDNSLDGSVWMSPKGDTCEQ